MTVTTFQPGAVLYAANLNTAFANTVNIAGDTMTGPLTLTFFKTTNGVSYANGGLNTSSTINTVQLNVAGMNVYSTITAAFAQANTDATLAQAAFDRANSGGAAGGFQTIITANSITVNTGTSLTVSGNNTVILSANTGNLTQKGVVQLNDTVTSTSSVLAATANAVNTVWATANAAFIKANSGVTNITHSYFTSNGITVNSGTSLITTGNGTVLISANIGNTTQAGIIQLEDTGTSTSIIFGGTANIANMIWTTAKAAFNKANAGGGAISQNFITTNGLSINSGSFLNTSGNNTLIFTGNNATTTNIGVVQLNDTVTSLSNTQAATANSVATTFNTAQAAFNAANAGFSGLQTTYIGGQGITVNNSTSFTVTGSGIIAFSANTGTTIQPGILQLNDTVNSTFANQAATANAINTVWATSQAAFNQANLNGPGVTTTFLTTNGLTVNTGTSFAAVGNTTLVLSANSGTTGSIGVVQLNDTVISKSLVLAATANSVNTVWATANAAFKAANTFAGGITTTYFTQNGITVNGGVSLIVVGTGNPVFSAANASLSATGVVQLNDTLNSTSLTLAATANSVNAVSRLANIAVLRTGDTMTGPLTVSNTVTVLNNLTVSGNSFLGNSSISSNGSISFGNQANTKGTLGRFVYGGSGGFANTGDVQVVTNILYRKATTNASFVLTGDGQTPRNNPYGSINIITLSNNSVYVFKGHVVGRDTITNITKVWAVEGVVKRGLGPANTVFVTGSPIINVIADDDPLTANWLLNITIDTANGGLQISTSSVANTTNWVSKIETIEVG